MERLRRVLAWIIGSGSAVASLIIRGGIVATVVYLGYWAYPVYLAADCLTAIFVAWLYGQGQSVEKTWLESKLGVSEANIKHKSFLVRVFTFLALLLIAAIGSPPFAATIVRRLGFRGREAYILILSITVPVSIFWTSIYLGFVEAFKYSFT